MKKIISMLLWGIFPIICLCQNAKPEMIQFIMQPEAEVNKKIDFEIYFSQLPDEGSLRIGPVKDLEITGIDELEGISIHKKGNFYSFYTYAKPTKPGKIEIPSVHVKINGIKYQSKPFSLKVVDKITIDSNSVKTVWMPDKTTYELQDTIKLSLYQYSKFSKINKRAPENEKPNGLSISGEGNEIKIKSERSLYNISGMQGLEEYLDQNFEITDFEWNAFGENQSMEKLDNEDYIKTEIFSIYLLANKKGAYTFQPSIFEYLIFKSNDDYFGRFTENEDGSYNITDKGSEKLKVSSNTVQINVR